MGVVAGSHEHAPDQAKAPGLPPGAIALSGQRELPSLEPLVR
jgi:hypothetical protein